VKPNLSTLGDKSETVIFEGFGNLLGRI